MVKNKKQKLEEVPKEKCNIIHFSEALQELKFRKYPQEENTILEKNFGSYKLVKENKEDEE